MIPILLIGALAAVVGYAIARSRETPRSPYQIGAETPRTPRTPRMLLPSSPCLDLFTELIRAGEIPDESLTNAAIAEAYDQGDIELADAILTAFEKRCPKLEGGEPCAPSANAAAPPTPPVAGDGHTRSSDTPTTEPSPNLDSHATGGEGDGSIAPISEVSPLDGVSDDAWQDFVAAVRTNDPSFATDRHVGAFHHRRDRIRQLGFDDAKLLDYPSQYQAFAKDVQDTVGKLGKGGVLAMIGDHVEIHGEPVSITLSGLLGLLKTAGKHSAQWLADPSQRERFPQTTEMFLRTNGHF